MFLIISSLFAFNIEFLEIRGSVKMIKDNQETFIERPGILSVSEQDELLTLKNSMCIIRLPDGNEIVIKQLTKLKFSQLDERSSFINLDSGGLRAFVKRFTPRSKFEIKTSVAAIAVRGTDFYVSHSGDVTDIEVYEGIVSAIELITNTEVQIQSGEYLRIIEGQIPEKPVGLEEEGRLPADVSKNYALKQIYEDISKDVVIALAQNEIKSAEYQNKKVLIDVYGKRVRLEEYITRPTENQFKYVVLNTREDRFDFGKILFTFNKALPSDLTLVTKDMIFKEGATAPEWYLTAVDSVMSNTVDKVNETFKDGEMIPDNAANPTYWSIFFKEGLFSVNDVVLWKFIDNGDRKLTAKEFSFLGGVSPKTEIIIDPIKFSIVQTNTYNDGTWIKVNDYIIWDSGEVAEVQDFVGFHINHVINILNFERVYTSSLFKKDKIDLVFSTKLLYDAGMIRLPEELR